MTIQRLAYNPDDNKSVFQAELFAIFTTIDWIIQHFNSHVHIYGDSLSGLQAVDESRTHNHLVLQIKT